MSSRGRYPLTSERDGVMHQTMVNTDSKEGLDKLRRNRWLAFKLYNLQAQKAQHGDKAHEQIGNNRVATMNWYLSRDKSMFKAYKYNMMEILPPSETSMYDEGVLMKYADAFENDLPVNPVAMKNELDDPENLVVKNCLKCNGSLGDRPVHCEKCNLALYCSQNCLRLDAVDHKKGCDEEVQRWRVMGNANFPVYLNGKDPMKYFIRNRRLSMQLCIWLARCDPKFKHVKSYQRFIDNASDLQQASKFNYTITTRTSPPQARSEYTPNEALQGCIEGLKRGMTIQQIVAGKDTRDKKRKCFYCFEYMRKETMCCRGCDLALYCSYECMCNDRVHHVPLCSNEKDFWSETNRKADLITPSPLLDLWNPSDTITSPRFLPRLAPLSRHRWLAAQLYVLYWRRMADEHKFEPKVRLLTLANVISQIETKDIRFGYLFTNGEPKPDTLVKAPLSTSSYILRATLLSDIKRFKNYDDERFDLLLYSAKSKNFPDRIKHICAYCSMKVVSGQFKGCEECRLALYCSEECFYADRANHEVECDKEISRWADQGPHGVNRVF